MDLSTWPAAIPWMAVVLLVPFLGLVAYHVVLWVGALLGGIA